MTNYLLNIIINKRIPIKRGLWLKKMLLFLKNKTRYNGNPILGLSIPKSSTMYRTIISSTHSVYKQIFYNNRKKMEEKDS